MKNATLTIAKKQKQTSCSSVEEWIKKTWYAYTMDFYLALKRRIESMVCCVDAIKLNEIPGHKETGLCGSLMENIKRSIDVTDIGMWLQEARDMGKEEKGYR